MRTLACLTAMLVVLSCVAPALASDVPPAAASAPTPDAAPLEISADQGLVWDRANRSYTAKGRAEVRQGDMGVTADQITAHYAGDDSASDIRRVTAEGNVTLSQPPYTAYGDHADYDVAGGTATLTGHDLRIITPDERLTAKDRITYHAVEGKMTAEGNAVMTRGTDSLQAQTLVAAFATDAGGKRALETVTATGGVTIKTPRETITGGRGVYHGRTQQAELTGDVVIEQGKNRLQGTRATVDMKTGVSKLFGGGSDGRVRGVFYPKQQAAAPAVVAPVAAASVPASVSAPVPAPTAAAVPAAPTAAMTVATPSAASLPDVKLAVDAAPTAPVVAPASKPFDAPTARPVSNPSPAPAPAAIPAPATATPAPAAATPTAPAAPAEEPVADLPDEPFAVPASEKTP